MLGLPGGSEWLIILLVIVIFFGGKKIPELMRGLGSGVRDMLQERLTFDEALAMDSL
ncbi:MAG TPA: twin-arginine translocase TatA/TatE family subunit, partial [Candidatus Kapabacteria bacterium]|nr:twin-arginine translocase TatA/TatE family subunit [Candidatus Kapabacteria bacterium]